jgi:hypothetical protein
MHPDLRDPSKIVENSKLSRNLVSIFCFILLYPALFGMLTS